MPGELFWGKIWTVQDVQEKLRMGRGENELVATDIKLMMKQGILPLDLLESTIELSTSWKT